MRREATGLLRKGDAARSASFRQKDLIATVNWKKRPKLKCPSLCFKAFTSKSDAPKRRASSPRRQECTRHFKITKDLP